jgi:hypothetical protein
MHSVRDVKAWEAASGLSFAALGAADREAANAAIAAAKRASQG